jgi:Cys-tRNA synthase (O-phospho-L-seryl-tRNA:Cys-tRNA synthase)
MGKVPISIRIDEELYARLKKEDRNITDTVIAALRTYYEDSDTNINKADIVQVESSYPFVPMLMDLSKSIGRLEVLCKKIPEIEKRLSKIERLVKSERSKKKYSIEEIKSASFWGRWVIKRLNKQKY